MFEYYNNNILCVQAAWLIEEGILTKPNFDSLILRGQIKRLQRGGNGRVALIEYETIRSDIKEKIIALAGDPTERAKHIHFSDYLKTDQNAVDFFNNYTLDSNDPLPDKSIKEYIANAEVLNAIKTILESTMSKRKALGSKVKPWEKITTIVQELPRHTWPHSLPANERRLQDRYKIYNAEGYVSLIHKGFCNKNTEKLADVAKSWVLARWSDRVRKCASFAQLLRDYNEHATGLDWPTLKTELSLRNFLQDPKIEALWYGYRYGELKAKEKYTYQHSTKLPSMRDSLWYSDGTKLNYYYLENGKMKTCQVYEVFDTYSEVFVGYHISQTEDYEAQYFAFKMALQTAGHKPYEIKFDNQGGHGKLEASSFLSKISRITNKTQPYNGKSKTIENAFGRFQAEYLKRDWFFTGMNITTKKLESRANMEFILDNVKNLPSLDEVKQVYKQRREQWNAAPHPKTGVSRLEMYLNSQNPATPEVSIWDMVDMFWITREKPVTANAYGISFTEKKIKYDFMVMKNNMPDQEWLHKNIDKKFIVKFDPSDMTLIHLYEQTPLGLRRVAEAEPKTVIHRNAQEQEDWEAEFTRKVNAENKAIRINTRNEMDELLADHDRLAEDYGLRSPGLKGIESSRKQKAKIKQASKPQEENYGIGDYQKKISNAVFESDESDKMDYVSIY
ncbi:kinase [Flavobacterium kingsejongi]|uniref:Kinase n=1 Tax=Flavobacterium kingsejongi TaxID=1678728 RepID=A0A2S1LMS9_9FLAO|nr:kinase [Flavobacterium kingsejongi]AWG24802.1 hypothetical protein FK004_05955 [Flavobacterium kingsejongi]AWG25052.1 hypothetical protein FK004_07300 [Flavobacterium kingsejongi]